MKNSDIKRWCLEHAGEPLTSEAESYLQEHPDVREEMDRLALTARLMSLKNHEEPAPYLETRCIARVQERIQSRRKRSWLYRLEDALTLHPAPVWVAASLLIALSAGLWISLHAPEPQLVDAVKAADTQVAETSPVTEVAAVEPLSAGTGTVTDIASVDRVIPLNEKPIIFMRMESNQLPLSQPGRIDYGSGSTVPVSFDY